MAEKKEELPYWEKEEPEMLIDKKLKIKFYENAGSLQLAMKGKSEGDIHIKRGVKLRKHILQKNPELLKKLSEIFTDWHDEIQEEQKN